MTDREPRYVTVRVDHGLASGRGVVVIMAMGVRGSAADRLFRLLILQAVHHMLKVRGTLQRLDPECSVPYRQEPTEKAHTQTCNTHTHLS